MPDVFKKQKRSEVMSQIRGSGNKDTELALAKLLRAHDITGWRRNQALTGKPDFTFHKQRIVVFVDGCFWHACPKHSKPAKWLRKSAMANKPSYQPSAVSGQPAVVREQCTNSYQTEEARQRPFDNPPTPRLRRIKLRVTTRGTENRKLRTGKAFWREKMAANIARDRFVNRELRKRGWRVVRIWEHELPQGRRTKYEGQKRVVEKIRKALNKA